MGCFALLAMTGVACIEQPWIKEYLVFWPFIAIFSPIIYNVLFSHMIVLGLDPGVRKLGYAVVDFTGNQKTLLDSGILFDDAPTTTRSVRYEKIHHISLFFNELFEKYTISRMGIEKLYFTSRNQSNAEFVYGMRAIIIDKALTKDILITEIYPVQVKKYIS